MKKLILAVAILAGASTYATVNNTLNPITPVHTVMSDEYQEIALDQVPAAVSDALTESFPTATLSKAYVNEKEEYKLEVSVENETKTLFADKEGNWLDAKEVE